MQGMTQGPAGSSAGCHSSQHRWLRGNITAKHVEVFPKPIPKLLSSSCFSQAKTHCPVHPPDEFLLHKPTQVPQIIGGLPASTAFRSSIPVHHAKEHLLLFLVSFTLVPLPEQRNNMSPHLNFIGFNHLLHESSSQVEETPTYLAALVPELSHG